MVNEIKEAQMEEIKKVYPTKEETLAEKPARNASHSDADGEKRAKKDYYIELALFLILGILVGIALKTEASKRITIGYNDYKMKLGQQQYDINKLQADLIKKQSKATEENSGQNADEGETCNINQ